MFVTTAFNDNEQKNTEQLKKRKKNQEIFFFWFVALETVFTPRPFSSDITLDEKLKCRASVPSHNRTQSDKFYNFSES